MSTQEIESLRVEFSVPFVRGKERPRVVKGHAYTPEGTIASERLAWTAFADECRRLYGRIVTAPEGVPVRLHIAAYGTMPASRPKKDGNSEPFTFKPDADNIAKLILDALSCKTRIDSGGMLRVLQQGAWMDDRQVVSVDICKVARYRGVRPHTDVIVTWPYDY